MPRNNLQIDHFNARDNDVQDVISRAPSMLVRWGLTVFSIVVLLFLFLVWFIKYPDIINARVTISTESAPVNLVARISGKISLYKRDNSLVNDNERIAFIQSNANPLHVYFVDSLLNQSDSISVSKKALVLGELQNSYNLWQKALENKSLFHVNSLAAKQIQALQKQIELYEKLVKYSQAQVAIIREEVSLAKVRFATDSQLFHQRVTSTMDFNKANADFLGQRHNLKNSEMTLINYELQIGALEKQVAEIKASQLANYENLNLEVNHSREELRAQLLKWKEMYLFQAPVSGSVSYLDFLEDGKFVEAGKALFSVIPMSKEIIGRAELPIAGSGKVKKGQKVNIRLENFPFEEYGMLEGTVKEISSLPTQGKYLVVIDLPKGMKTTNNENLTFKQQMQGDAEIVTNDFRLVERFYFQFIKAAKTR